MYGYIIEKQIGNNMLTDLGHITSLVENINNVHHLLSSLFDVKEIECWRSKNNILYYVEFKSGYRLHIKSDKEINEEEVANNGFKIISRFEYDFKDNDVLDVEILVAPFKKQKGELKRTYIQDKNEREEWLKYKLECDDNVCEIIDIKEGEMYKTYMKHDTKEKGETELVGLNYSMTLKVNDSNKFKKIIKTGIGSEKNYGFGMIRVS